jgi:hypothetical protein
LGDRVSAATSRAATATVLATLAILGTTALPWLRTGDTRRSAFAMARGVDALGLVDSPGRRALLVSWYLLPFLTAATFMARALGRQAAVAGLGALLGAMSVAAGSLVMVWARPEIGPVAAVASGAAALGAAGRLARSIRSDDSAVQISVEGRRT